MFLKAYAIQSRVISALMFREFKTRFGRAQLGVFWLFFEPLMHLGVLILLWTIIGRMGPTGIEPTLFLLTGLLPYFFFRNTVTRIIKAVDANRALLIFPQVHIIDLAITRMFIEIIVYVISFAIILLALWLFGLPVHIHDLGGLILASLLLWFSSLATGLFFLPLVAVLPIFQHLVNITLRIGYFVSGIMFSIERIPHQYHELVLWNPMYHMVQIIRHSFFIQIDYDPRTMDYEFVGLFYGLLFVVGILLRDHYKSRILESK